MLCLLCTLSLSLSLYSSSPYDRRHRPPCGNISYEGSGMILGWFIRLQWWFRFFLPANGRTDERTDEGVPRGPRGPKNDDADDLCGWYGVSEGILEHQISGWPQGISGDLMVLEWMKVNENGWKWMKVGVFLPSVSMWTHKTPHICEGTRVLLPLCCWLMMMMPIWFAVSEAWRTVPLRSPPPVPLHTD